MEEFSDNASELEQVIAEADNNSSVSAQEYAQLSAQDMGAISAQASSQDEQPEVEVAPLPNQEQAQSATRQQVVNLSNVIPAGANGYVQLYVELPEAIVAEQSADSEESVEMQQDGSLLKLSGDAAQVKLALASLKLQLPSDFFEHMRISVSTESDMPEFNNSAKKNVALLYQPDNGLYVAKFSLSNGSSQYSRSEGGVLVGHIGSDFLHEEDFQYKELISGSATSSLSSRVEVILEDSVEIEEISTTITANTLDEGNNSLENESSEAESEESDDTEAVTSDNSTLEGTIGDDTLTASDINQKIYAYAGNDLIIAYASTTGFTSQILPSDLNGSNGFIVSGFGWNGWQSESISEIGDINNDGYDDFALGSPNNPTPISPPGSLNYGYAGEAVVFYGGSSFSTRIDRADIDGSNGLIVPASVVTKGSGHSVGNAGDVNGDGISDFIFSSPYAQVGGNNNAGEVYVIFGQNGGIAHNFDVTTLDGTNGFAFGGPTAGDYIGWTSLNAGDIDGDGFSDIVVGSNYYGSGSAFVVFGTDAGFAATLNASALNGTNGFLINDSASDAGWGVSKSVNVSGDVNGDGYNDIIVSAPYDTGASNRSGKVYVIYGDPAKYGANFDLNNINGVNGSEIIGPA